MTLDQHKLDGIAQITAKTLLSTEFELLLVGAGYEKIGTAPAQGNRLKVWWTHSTFRRNDLLLRSSRRN